MADLASVVLVYRIKVDRRFCGMGSEYLEGGFGLRSGDVPLILQETSGHTHVTCYFNTLAVVLLESEQ
jgi:hypothetical protein